MTYVQNDNCVKLIKKKKIPLYICVWFSVPVEPPYFNAYKHNVEDNGNSCSVLLKWSPPGDTLIDIDNYSIRFTTNNWETCEEKLLPWDIYEYVIQNAQQHAHYLFEIVSISNEVCSIPLKRIYSTKRKYII